MGDQNSFQRLVRARMVATGESYEAARAGTLAAKAAEAGAGAALLPYADATVLRATGRGWEAWFELIDGWGGATRGHAEIARWLSEEHGVAGWWAQGLTVGFERARGDRAVGETVSGFQVSASKTVAVPVDRLFDAFVDPKLRSRWLPDGVLSQRTATRAKSARFSWGDGVSRVNLWFSAKGADKSSVALSHERLSNATEAARMKSYWAQSLTALKALLEG